MVYAGLEESSVMLKVPDAARVMRFPAPLFTVMVADWPEVKPVPDGDAVLASVHT